MSLASSYRLFAPLYDLAVARATATARARSLAELPAAGAAVLVTGIGTGLDVSHLPAGNRYVGLDLTPAMLSRVPRSPLDLALVQGDATRLPFADGVFDHVVLHLIVAVVPEPARCLTESARVLKSGGTALVLDKFLRRGARAPLRRALSPLVSRIATRLDVVLDDLLEDVPTLALERNEPALAGGWFRLIRLRKLGSSPSAGR